MPLVTEVQSRELSCGPRSSFRRVWRPDLTVFLQRALTHLGGFNLLLVMRQLLGKGTLRGNRCRVRGIDQYFACITAISLEQLATSIASNDRSNPRNC